MRQGKKLFGPILKRGAAALLFTVFLLSLCVSCAGRSTSEQLAQADRDRVLLIYIADCLDEQGSVYSYLHETFAQLSEEPGNTELRTKLAGALEAVKILKLNNMDRELSMYQNYSPNNQELYSVVTDAAWSIPSPDEKLTEILALPAEQLAEIAQCYYQLSNCFFRGNTTTLASVVVDKKFDGEEFQDALETTNYLLSKLDGLIHFKEE